MNEFQPPILESRVITYHPMGEAALDRASILITDANHRLFTLTVGTFNDYREWLEECLRSGADLEGSSAEPIFLIPVDQIEPDMLDEIEHMPPRFLARYLVEQTDEAA